MTDAELERLRAQTAATDAEILDLVNRRLELVREIRTYKEANGIAFLDPDQEARLLSRLRELNRGPLSDDSVDRLFGEILALIKRELD
jgi:chorismate mutase/prephenate dehydratase